MKNEINSEAAPAPVGDNRNPVPIYMRHLRDMVESTGGTMEQDSGGRFEVWQCCTAYGQVWKCGSKHIRLEWQPGVSTSQAARQQAIVEALESVKCGVREMSLAERLECDEPALASGQHTPGPWHIDTSNGEYAMVTNMGEHVFLIGDERRLIPMPEDARLIASAPTLLEALKACERELSWLVYNGYEDSPLHALRDQARTAIAMAGGDK